MEREQMVMDKIEVVRRVYRAMAARDLDALFGLLGPDVVVTQDPALPWGGRHVGYDGFARFGRLLTGAITSTVEHEALFVADGEVIQVGRTRGTVNANGASFD